MCSALHKPYIFHRYNEAKDLAKNLEKQANKVRAEAEEAGDKAMKIYTNLTSLPPFDIKSLEVEMLAIGFGVWSQFHRSLGTWTSSKCEGT